MDVARLQKKKFDSVEQSYSERDTMLYALGLGYGENPLSPDELQFVYEEKLKAVPSMSAVLCHPGFWTRDTEFGIDWVKLLHAEQEIELHRPLPASGTLRGEFRVRGIEDKGANVGAMLHQDKMLYDAATGEHVATVRSTLMLRGDGGQGGFGEAIPSATPLPEGAPTRTATFKTLDRAALIYRLSGDYNPLHADPAIARSAGFDKPILHGLCTFGIACRAILQTYCENKPERFKSMFVRFRRPVFPGETIHLEFFEGGDTLRFRAIAEERNQVVLDRGSAQFT